MVKFFMEEYFIKLRLTFSINIISNLSASDAVSSAYPAMNAPEAFLVDSIT